MPAALEQLADSVATAIGLHDFGLSLTARWGYPDYDLQLVDTGTIYIDVHPVGHPRSELEARYALGYQLTVDVVVRKKFLPADLTAGRVKRDKVSELVLLVEKLAEFHYTSINRGMASGDAQILSDGVLIGSTYSPKHLKEWHQFTGVLRLTYELTKTIA